VSSLHKGLRVRGMANESRYQMVRFGTVVFLVFAVLSLSNCLEILFELFHSPDSQDVRDLWPLELLFYSLLAFGYAVAFSMAMRITCRADVIFAAIYNIVLASLLFLHGYLYYTIVIDWLAVNSHIATLTAFQNMGRNDFIRISIYAIFLLGAVVVGRKRKVRR
jgi:hypothetical protein